MRKPKKRKNHLKRKSGKKNKIFYGIIISFLYKSSKKRFLTVFLEDLSAFMQNIFSIILYRSEKKSTNVKASFYPGSIQTYGL